MNLLAIETATETCSVALAVDGEVLEHFEHAPRRHAELVLPWVQMLLADAGIGFAALDGIAFSQGPGSFTSLRIGIGVVQGLAWGTDCPVIPVSSLAATAQTAASAGIGSALVALDARMNEVFTGQFEANSSDIMRPVSAEKVCKPADVCYTGEPPHGVGVGFDRYPALRQLAARLPGIRANTWPSAASVLVLARAWLDHHEALPAMQAQPVYLRDNVAQKPKA